jgi:hypothetical protein
MPIFDKFIINQPLLERFLDLKREASKPYESKVYEKAITKTITPKKAPTNYEEWKKMLQKELKTASNKEKIDILVKE